MKCHYCGTELHGNELFCRHCGTRQTAAPAATAPMPIYEESTSVSETPVMPEPIPVPQQVPELEEPPLAWKPFESQQPAAEPLFDFEKAPVRAAAPNIELPTGRSLAKMIFLGILTFGIYPTVIWSRLVSEVNITTSRYDGERSMSYFGMVMLAPFTLGIHSLVWIHKLCRRIGAELERRKLAYAFGARDFWLWNVLLGFLCAVCIGIFVGLYLSGSRSYWVLWVLLVVSILTVVGPFIFTSKLMKAMNKLNADFNING